MKAFLFIPAYMLVSTVSFGLDIWSPGLFQDTPEMILFDYFLGICFTMFLPMLIIVLVIMITQRS